MATLNTHAPQALPPPAHDTRRLRHAFLAATAFAGALWLIKIAESLLGLSLVEYGVYPGRLDRLPSVVWSPLLHASFSHLFANTGAIIILGTALLYGYPKSAKIVIPAVYLGSNLGVWLFARHAYHIGASGLTFGMMFFTFTVGALRRDKRAIALSLLVFFLYGGMIWGVFPVDPNISFESHFFGAAIGVALAFLLRNRDPAPPEKRYSWEEEQDAAEADAPGNDERSVLPRDNAHQLAPSAASHPRREG